MPPRSVWRPLHSSDPVDAAWRSEQAHVDADIEGLARDPEADRMVAKMEAEGVPVERQIERLKLYFSMRAAKLQKP